MSPQLLSLCLRRRESLMTQSPATDAGCAPPGHLRHVRRARRLPRHAGGGDGAGRRGAAPATPTGWRWWPTTTRTSCRSSHAHHEGEEEVVFPLLRDALPRGEALLDELAEQHEEAMALLATARQWLAAWPGGGDAVQLELVGALGSLRAHLVEHLDEEERRGLPLAAEYLSAEEWGQLPGPRAARLRRGQGLADPRADPRAHERGAARRHAGPHATARRRYVDGLREHAFMELSSEVPVEVLSRVP